MRSQIVRDDLTRYSMAFNAQARNVIARNAVSACGIQEATRDAGVTARYIDSFNVSIPTRPHVVNQRKSGRCWLFAALNVMREHMMDRLGVKDLELSQSYLQFYDKLEKANVFLDQMVRTAWLPADDRLVCWLLDHAICDGGFWTSAAALINKYGVIPHDCMPDSAVARDTEQMNRLLKRMARIDAMKLRDAVRSDTPLERIDAMRDSMLQEFYRVLCICLGEPPKTIEWSYVADARPLDPDHTSPRDPRFTCITGMDPREFPLLYCDVSIDDYVDLISIPGAGFPWGNVCQQDYCEAVIDAPIRQLNVPMDALTHTCIASLEGGSPIWFACDVRQNLNRTDGIGILDTRTFDLERAFDLDLWIDKEQAFEYGESRLNHAMNLRGVNLDDDGQPSAWRVENSWGTEQCREGYLIMSDDWFQRYVGEAIIERRFVPDEILRMWDDPQVIHTNPWSPLYCSIG